MSNSSTKRVWLDCDPGHDDATAILLALHTPGIKLVGVSTVGGNAELENTFKNASKCLYAFGASDDLLVHRGAAKPLVKPSKQDAEIHGNDGLGGVEGLPDANHPAIRARLERSLSLRAIEGIAEAVRDAINTPNAGKVTIVSTGPMTNIALFVSVYPDLIEGVEEFVFMGGAVGMGNRSSVAEYNILCDPESAQIVLDIPVKITMMPINITHQAIVTKAVHAKLLAPSTDQPGNVPLKSGHRLDALPPAETPLRHTLSTLMSFFAASYEMVFGFTDGPPLHDALTIAYVAHPEFFTCTRYRVDVELCGTHTTGETVVDVFDYQQCGDTWGKGGKNCLVAQKLDVDAFFEYFLECVQRCDRVSPLNTP